MNNIPYFGLGTWKLQGEQCYNSIRTALDIGYRHIDTAHIYDNHRVIGQVISDSSLNRDELWLTSKLWMTDFTDPRAALERSLGELQTDYVDLFLIHRPTNIEEHHRVFDVLLKLKQEGKIHRIGISNFSYSQCDDAIVYLGSELYAVQYEYHVCLDQSPLLDRCRQHNIILEAYSPLAHGKLSADLSTMKGLEILAHKYNCSVSQVMLAWLLDQKVVVLPKASSYQHLLENFSIPKISFDASDKKLIAGFPKHFRYCNPSSIAPQRNS